MTGRRKRNAAIALALTGVALASERGWAHKPVTSPYTYNEDVFPIVRDRCGRCHVSGGVAPMSLLTYKDAFPWGESIRTELVAGHMPPWGVETANTRFKNAQGLTARELNVLLTWVTGGNPMGKPEKTPASVPARNGWPLGAPDLILSLPAETTLPADTQERTQEFTLATGIKEERWVRAVDLLPQTPAIVRSATIAVRAGESSGTDRGIAPQRTLALWLPGEDPVPLEGAAFRLPAGAELVVRARYKKTWEYERQVMTDRSAVGLYFASGPSPSEVRSIALTPSTVATASGHEISFSRLIEEDLRALAVSPDSATTDAQIQVRAVRPDGTTIELIRFQPRAEWTRRYWFEQPVFLPSGTRLEVAAAIDPENTLLLPGAPPAAKPPDLSSLRIMLDVVGAAR
jgi:hypothetical protein